MRELSTGKPQTPRPGRVRGAAFVTALLFACGVFAGPTATPGQSGQALTLSASDYEARVYAAWIGQIIGNIYGLSYEFRFIDDAGPDDFGLDGAREIELDAVGAIVDKGRVCRKERDRSVAAIVDAKAISILLAVAIVDD